jgi:hypothetical protein
MSRSSPQFLVRPTVQFIGLQEHKDASLAVPPSHCALASGRASSGIVDSSSASHTSDASSRTGDTPALEAPAQADAAAAPPASSATTLAAAAAPRAAAAVASVARGSRWSLFIYGAFGGRFDHEMANLNALFAHAGDWAACFSQVVLLGEDCAACLLPAGSTRITITAPGEGPKCGLLPVGGPVDSVRTRGLHWDLAGQRCAFGGLVSTSNWVESVYPYAHVCNVDTSTGSGGGAVAGAPGAVGVAAASTAAADAAIASEVGASGDVDATRAGAPAGEGCCPEAGAHRYAAKRAASSDARVSMGPWSAATAGAAPGRASGHLPPTAAESGSSAAAGTDGRLACLSTAAASDPSGDAACCCYCSVHAGAVEVEASQPIVWTTQLDWRHALSGGTRP